MLSKSDFDITKAIQLFNSFSIEATYLVPTSVGLEKSIMDATASVRAYLKAKSIHNYEGQLQGPEGKKTVPAFIVTESTLIPTTVSLYRPRAKGKEGDPRIWISKLSTYAAPNNLIGLFASDGKLYIVNLSHLNTRNSVQDPSSPLGHVLRKLSQARTSTAEELLQKLIEIAARGLIPTMTSGDTGIGATLEKCLGIETNSSRNPDYKGIEIKAKRLRNLRATTRNTLFAQVPNWELSRLKSSAQILDAYGYFRGPIKKLYCTVRASVPNTQGLMLRVDEAHDLLHEVYLDGQHGENVVSWSFDVLRNRLLTKHNETFWVGAESSDINGIEHFQYKRVLHTRLPFASNFLALCEQGIVTVDHLIKRDEEGRVVEKGPLFKISENHLDLLFPPPAVYDL